jgi:hypothetical protein
MVGSGDGLAGGAASRGRLRASDADREQVIDVLKAAFTQGRLAKDEFDRRVAQALASRTYADLDALTTDLPAGPAAVQPPSGPAPATAGSGAGAGARWRERVIIATAMLAPLVFIAAFFAPNPVAGLIGLGAFGSALVSLSLAGVHMLSSRRDRRSRGRLPPPQAIDTGPGAGPRAAAAAPVEQLPDARPRPPGRTDAGPSRVLRPRLSG